MNPKDDSNSKIRSFLRRKDDVTLEKFEKQTEVKDNKQFIKEKLFDKPKEPIFEFNFREFVVRAYYKIKNNTWFFQRKSFKDNVPLAVFVSFSMFILWKMEAQLDTMRNKVYVKRSVKQMEIERENEV
jgi:hypothetical protein